jgi:hypothetical protein
LTAFLILFEIKDLSYEQSLKMMNNNFKARILDYDKNNMPVVTLKKLEIFTKSESFDVEAFGRQNKVAGVLANWIYCLV